LVSALSPVEVPFLVSIRPLRSSAEAQLLRHEVPDVSIPDTALEKMANAEDDPASIGLDLAAELVAVITPLAAGIVVSLGNHRDSSLAVLQRLGARR
jgi:5,10-methylenetetrahydrofolate reductase